MSTITLFHVSSKPRTSLEVKVAKNWNGENDFAGVYLSLTLEQAQQWAEALTEARGVEFKYFYKVEVPRELVFQKGTKRLHNWRGSEDLIEVIYVGPKLTNLVGV